MNISDQIKWNMSGDIHILTIMALKPYNGTTVKCLARLSSNHCQQGVVDSPTVNLLIQGTLTTTSCIDNTLLFLLIIIMHAVNEKLIFIMSLILQADLTLSLIYI